MKNDQMEHPQRASVPAFGGWDDVAAGGAGGALPDYSLDFSKIRAARMQRRKALSWSSGAAVTGTAEDQQISTAAGGSERRRGHRRQHSDDDTEARQPIRAPHKEARSKFKGYLFGCMGRWYVAQH